MENNMRSYDEYMTKVGDRKELYRLIANEYNIRKAVYPGSHIDITPSIFIPEVVYIDSYKGAIQFFEDLASVNDYINKNKEYLDESKIIFYGVNYETDLNLEKVDLIISQFAGFVGHATKKYLQEGGILLANDSHGDATLAYLDDDYEFIGAIDSHNRIESSNLEKYFRFSREREIDIEKVMKTMKGPKYKYQACNYIFRLRSDSK